jgi:hypothetical protein
MPTLSYAARRGELLEYFDRTAVEAWKRLTSDAPVNSIRATVRAGRDDVSSTPVAARARCRWRPLGAVRRSWQSTFRPP